MNRYEYLNYNSTFYGGASQFNPSDIGYEEVENELDRQAEIIGIIKKIVNADENYKVIFTSGATEGIASVMNWCRNINKFGVVVGSRLDHASVKDNAENYGFKYEVINFENNNKKVILPDNVAMIFMTHVSPKTGEIYPFDRLPKLQYLTDTIKAGGDVPEDIYGGENLQTLQQRPLKILDITQSIGKIPIDLKGLDIDGAMFSLHKLGGELNTGILIVKETKNRKFKPLIAGSQQNNLRGGTYNAYAYNLFPTLFTEYPYKMSDCKKRWLSAKKYLNDNLDKEARLQPKLLEPRFNHVYNTLLIQLNDCGLGVIKKLSDMGIYLSASSACSTKNKDKFIRISFLKSEDLSDSTLKKIVKTINEA